METQTASVKKIAYNYGLMLALVSIIVLVIMYVGNLDKSWVLSSISFILSVLIIVYGIKNYKKENSNYISLKEALKVGLAISVVAGIIGAVYSYIHYEFIYPEFIENIKEQSRLQMMEQYPNMSEEDREQSLKVAYIFTSPFMFSTISLIGTLFIGFIVSLITGAVIKNENPQQ